eukprot:TCONS_00007264-protein
MGIAMLLLSLFALSLTGVICSEVFISQSTGIDSLNCGTSQLPCKSIEFALKKDDQISVLSLMESYRSIGPIAISGNQILIRRATQVKSPITLSFNGISLFNYENTTTNSSLRFSFQNLELNNVTLFSDETVNTNVYFTINDCTIQGSKPIIKTLPNRNQTKTNDFLAIDIRNSTIDISGYIIQHSAASLLKINIQDSSILTGAIFTNTSLNLNIHNTRFEGGVTSRQQTTQAKILEISGNPQQTLINLTNIEITGNHFRKTFLHCKNSDIYIHNISLRDCKIGQLFDFTDVTSIIEGGISLIGVQSEGAYLIDTKKSIVKFTGLVNLLDSHAKLLKGQQKSHLIFDHLQVIDTVAEHILMQLAHSQMTVRELKLQRHHCTHTAVFIQNSNVTIENAEILNSKFQFGFFLFSNSRLIINRGRYLENEVSTNFWGIAGSHIALYNTEFHKNKGWQGHKLAMNNIIAAEQKSNVIFKNINITENAYFSGIKASSSNMDLNYINFVDNRAYSHGKTVIYEGETCDQSFNISIQNIFARITNQQDFEHMSAIFSIDIIHSALILDNVVIDVQSMSYPQISTLHLRFATLNTKVLQNPNNTAYIVKCPPSYNPSGIPKLQFDFYSYTLLCIPCSRGTYTLARGSESLRYIDNVDWDVETWKNNDRTFDVKDFTHVQGCTACPAGGNCTFGIKSQGNYYGQIKKETEESEEVEFIPCPSFYCCSNLQKTCQNITSCNTNRKGTLCGSCEDGFFENYFYPTCISNNECTAVKMRRFWLVYTATAFVLTILIFSIKDLSYFLAGVALYLKVKLTALQKKFMKTRSLERYKKTPGSINYNGHQIINDCLAEPEKPRRFIFSAVLQITLAFFQIVSLIKLRNQSNTSKTMTRIFDLFNLQIALDEAEIVCPFESMNVVWKYFIKNVLFIICMVMFLIIATLINQFIRLFKCKSICKSKSFEYFSPPEHQRLNFLDKLVVCYTKVLAFGYKNISLFAIISLNCVEVNSESVLYISGNIKCFQGWQYAVALLLFLWIIPFPAALVYSYKLFDRGLISEKMFLLSLCFPALSVYFFIKYRNSHDGRFIERHGLKAVLYDIFEEPYRVISVNEFGVPATMYWWNAWRLYERLIIVVLVNFFIEPLLRMCVIAPIMIFLLMLHYHVRPYKETMTLLSWLDISSFACLSFYVVDNMFRSFAYIFDIPLKNQIAKALTVLEIFEAILTPLTVICIFIVTFGFEAVYEFTRNLAKKTT